MVIIVFRVVCLCVIVFHSTVAGSVTLHLSWKVKGQQPNILLNLLAMRRTRASPNPLSPWYILPSLLFRGGGEGQGGRREWASNQWPPAAAMSSALPLQWDGVVHGLAYQQSIIAHPGPALAAVHPDVRIWAWVYPSSLLQDFWWDEF